MTINRFDIDTSLYHEGQEVFIHVDYALLDWEPAVVEKIDATKVRVRRASGWVYFIFWASLIRNSSYHAALLLAQ